MKRRSVPVRFLLIALALCGLASCVAPTSAEQVGTGTLVVFVGATRAVAHGGGLANEGSK